MEKIRITSSKNNRALIDENLLGEYLERGWKVGWPEDEATEKVQETADQLNAEEKVGDEIVEPTLEVADDKPEVVLPDAEVAE